MIYLWQLIEIYKLYNIIFCPIKMSVQYTAYTFKIKKSARPLLLRCKITVVRLAEFVSNQEGIINRLKIQHSGTVCHICTIKSVAKDNTRDSQAGSMNFDPVKYVKETFSLARSACEMNFDPLFIFNATIDTISKWIKLHFEQAIREQPENMLLTFFACISNT